MYVLLIAQRVQIYENFPKNEQHSLEHLFAKVVILVRFEKSRFKNRCIVCLRLLLARGVFWVKGQIPS